jgi:hypothetical protein
MPIAIPSQTEGAKQNKSQRHLSKDAVAFLERCLKKSLKLQSLAGVKLLIAVSIAPIELAISSGSIWSAFSL